MNVDIAPPFLPLFDESDPNYKRRNLVYWGGRGSGKTVHVAKGLLLRGLKSKILVLCVREFQNSISDSVIKTLEDEIEALGLAHFYTVQNNAILGKNGTEFMFKGVKNNVQSIKSMANLDYIWAEEAQTISEKSWEVLIPTLRKDGSQFIITFNPNQPTDPTYKRFVADAGEDTLALKVNYDDNPWFPNVLRAEMEKLRTKDFEAYQHIYEGQFDTRRTGHVYAKALMALRNNAGITKVPYDPSCQVFTAWDLGYGDSTAIWWLQYVGRELRWLECYENSGEQLGHYASIVKAKDYNYYKNGHFLPHDGAHGNIRGDSVSLQLDKLGISNTVLEREADINPGIELTRQTIHFSVFDKELTAPGVHALEAYHYEWDDVRMVFKDKPCHDWSSNYADAARYAARAAKMVSSGFGKTIAINYKPGYSARGAGAFS